MTLRNRTLLLLALTLLGLIAALGITANRILLVGFARVERADVRESVQRVQDALGAANARIKSTALDWGGWDDTYAFIRGGRPGYVKENLHPETLQNLGLNLFVITRNSGEVLCAVGQDLAHKKLVPAPPQLRKRLPANSSLIQRDRTAGGTQGLLVLPEGVMLISAQPITDTQFNRPSDGTLILGKLLNAAMVEELRRLTHLNLDLVPWNPALLPADESRALLDGAREVVRTPNAQLAEGDALLRDIDGQPALLLRVKVPREVHREGQRSLQYLLASIVCAGLALGAVMLLLVEKSVLAPLHALTRGVGAIRASGKLSGRLNYSGTDELARLAGGIDEMMEALEQAQARGREDDQRRQLIARATTDAVWDWDLETGYLWWGENAEAVLGYPSETIGPAIEWWEDRVHPEDRARTRLLLSQCRAGEQPLFQAEYRFRRADGSYIYVLDRGYPIRDAGGKVRRMVGAMIDVSEWKRVEAEVRRAREAADAADRAKSDFLANVSHEIRTPLNGILGMTELVLDSELEAQQREYLEIIKSCGDSLLTLVNDVLDFSKLNADKLELTATEFNPEALVESTLKTLRLRAGQKGLELKWEAPEAVPAAVIGDAGRLRQVLINLVGNAVKFTERGEIAVTMRVVEQTAERVCLQFAVRDTGIGIPPEKHAHIFEAFAQADSSTTRQYGGTGLGLSISKRLVELMGGRLWLESAPGTGSTFFFTVPLEVPLLATRFTAPPGAAVPSGVSAAPGLRLLVAEDNAINQTVVRRMLEKRGHHVTLVKTGREAVAAVENGNFHLVLMDVQMPEMSGLEATAAIRKGEQGSGGHLPIVAMTAHALEGDRERCLAAGMDDYLSKPVHSEALYAVLDRLAPPAEEPEAAPAEPLVGAASGL